ncbi:hypothetical protein K3148_11475 [Qipengyuania aurantiaca]|uniref:Uncharacterized protein n=1 Tax=Qipengyuania aurantiaca TaxID=2867233 RepID=A0ABX8ZK98_9SPHN|nr:hypothetical protein [Qipengyuania aurantiaca]QZD89425.1 hypothetical protein K3148_11475 [Qipengyuania aurantiaca]
MNALVTVEQAPTAGPHGEGHTLFSPRRQAKFLQHLQLFGNVRLAAKAARVSAQTAYRQRRASPALRKAWDAALLAARDHAEQVLASRALDGWEEAVFYHGEEVARRRRYSDRLLLAHLARLDRLEEREEVADTLPRLDTLIDRLRDGRALEENLPQDRVPPVPSCREGPPAKANGAAGQGSGAYRQADDPLDRPCDCIGAGKDGGGSAHWRMGTHGPEPVANTCGDGPCCNDPSWPECRACPHFPSVERMMHEMEEARPEDAPDPQLMGSPSEVDDCQTSAFVAGDRDWWRYGAGFVRWQKDGEGEWYSPIDGA